MPGIQATLETEIRRIRVQGQPKQKGSQNNISTNKLGMVIHTCDHSYVRGISKRTVV
jgi:hypothetical protein